MKADEFQALLGGLAKLSAGQRETLLRLLSGPPPEEAVVAMLESEAARRQRQCPHCAGKRLLAWGKSDGLSRYRCGDCRRTFNALTGTPLARMRYKAHAG